MSNDERNPKHEFQAALADSSFVVRYSFELRHPSFGLPDLLWVFLRIPSL